MGTQTASSGATITEDVTGSGGYLDMKGAAAFSTLSYDMIRLLIRRGTLPAFKVGTRVLIAKCDLDALIRAGAKPR